MATNVNKMASSIRDYVWNAAETTNRKYALGIGKKTDWLKSASSVPLKRLAFNCSDNHLDITFFGETIGFERKQQYLSRLRNGELLSQKINHITALLNSPESTSVITDGVVHFGDCVKLCHNGNGTEFNVSLASDVPLQAFLQPESSLGTLNICAIKDGPSVKRNTFTIKHKQDNINYRRPLCFGETFFLSSSVFSDNWYLGSRMITFGNSTNVTQHQEMFLSSSSSFYTEFKVVHPDIRWAVEKEGSPVPINEHVLINHVFTNQALALESAPIRTLFGDIYEVSTHTYVNRSGHQVDRRNLWKFTSGFLY